MLRSPTFVLEQKTQTTTKENEMFCVRDERSWRPSLCKEETERDDR